MVKSPRLTDVSLKVLNYMMESPGDEHYGFELMKACDLASGSLYRTLARFRDAGWLYWRVEDIDPAAEGRPARTYYRLTPNGVVAAAEALQPYRWSGGAAGALA